MWWLAETEGRKRRRLLQHLRWGPVGPWRASRSEAVETDRQVMYRAASHVAAAIVGSLTG